MADRLKGTFQGGSPDKWANGKIGYMRYNSANVWYQFAGLHYEGTTPYQDHDDIAGLDIINFPIVSKGITAYVLCRFGKAAEIKIFTDYYHSCLSKFKDIEDKKPGAYKRNLDSEFYSIHISEEKERIKFSQKIDEYISENELEFVNNHTQNYLTYIEQVYSPKDVTGSNQPNQPLLPENEVTDLINEIEHKPIFKPETIETIFDLLKGFFYQIRHNELQKLLNTGNNVSEPLIFLSNGNRLADAFKQLIKSDVITGCDQIHLENWILKNFKYLFRGQITDYTPKYLNDIISTTKDKCQKPILNVKIDNSTGKIIIRKA